MDLYCRTWLGSAVPPLLRCSGVRPQKTACIVPISAYHDHWTHIALQFSTDLGVAALIKPITTKPFCLGVPLYETRQQLVITLANPSNSHGQTPAWSVSTIIIIIIITAVADQAVAFIVGYNTVKYCFGTVSRWSLLPCSGRCCLIMTQGHTAT